MVKKLRRKSIQDLGRDGGSAVGDGKSEKMTNSRAGFCSHRHHGETACDPGVVQTKARTRRTVLFMEPITSLCTN